MCMTVYFCSFEWSLCFSQSPLPLAGDRGERKNDLCTRAGAVTAWGQPHVLLRQWQPRVPASWQSRLVTSALGGRKPPRGCWPPPPTLAAGPGAAQPQHDSLDASSRREAQHFRRYWIRTPIAVVAYKYMCTYMYVF